MQKRELRGAKDACLLELMTKNRNGEITVEETDELSALMREGQAC